MKNNNTKNDNRYMYFLKGILDTLEQQNVNVLNNEFLELAKKEIDSNSNNKFEIWFKGILEGMEFSSGKLSIEKLQKKINEEINQSQNNHIVKPPKNNEFSVRC